MLRELPMHPHKELAAYVEGALTPDADQAVRAHLAGCAACRAEVAQLRALEGSLRAWSGIEPRFAAVPYSAKQALRARLAGGAGGPVVRGATWAVIGGLLAVLAIVIGGRLLAPNGGMPGPSSPPVRWTTFVSDLGLGHVPVFSLDYPSDWNLTQTVIAPPSMTISLRFSTYKPPVGEGLGIPGPDDAEIWLAVGQGSLQAGWPAEEIASLRGRGYQERSYRVGEVRALRLTDTAPHFGLYDAVYVPLGSDFTARVYLSAVAHQYEALFDTMLARFQVGAVPTPTPLPPPRSYVRSLTGGTSTACGTRDFWEWAPEPTPERSLPLSQDETICINSSIARRLWPQK
jgi:hypothetical protein